MKDSQKSNDSIEACQERCRNYEGEDKRFMVPRMLCSNGCVNGWTTWDHNGWTYTDPTDPGKDLLAIAN